MLRSKGLTEKVVLLGIDGMDPTFSRRMIDEGKMPNLKKVLHVMICVCWVRTQLLPLQCGLH